MSDLLYAERDIQELDVKGNYYSKHVRAMTAEGLHSKSDIAAELAYRDARIGELEEMLVAVATGDYELVDSGLDAEDGGSVIHVT